MHYFWLPEMKPPFFSIILPTYNRASFLPRTIGSVLSQTLLDWELIVIDDGSKDHTNDVVSSYNDPRIRYIYQENAERSAARNKGIAAAKGEWICFLDSDDEYLPNHLEHFQSFINVQEQGPTMFVSGIQVQYEQGGDVKREFLDESNSMLMEIGEKFIIPSQVCAHASVFDQHLFYEQTHIWEDTHLWLRLAAQFLVVQTKTYTVIQHVHAGGTVSEGFQKIKWTDVMQYLNAIDDLSDNYWLLFEGKLPTSYFNDYKKAKINMYLYQARQNKQVAIALKLWWMGVRNTCSWYLLLEFPKIFFNALNIGIHEQ